MLIVRLYCKPINFREIYIFFYKKEEFVKICHCKNVHCDICVTFCTLLQAVSRSAVCKNVHHKKYALVTVIQIKDSASRNFPTNLFYKRSVLIFPFMSASYCLFKTVDQAFTSSGELCVIIVLLLSEYKSHNCPLVVSEPILPLHYENLPMQYTENFKVVKNEKFQ